MSKKKMIILAAVLAVILALAAGIVLIQPKETVINETIRFYSPGELQVEDYTDDTPLSGFAEQYVDVETDIRILQGVGSDYVEGTLKFGEEIFYASVEIKGDVVGIARGLQSAGNRGVETSQMRITDDLKHIHIFLSRGAYKGYWTNDATLGEYIEAVNELNF